MSGLQIMRLLSLFPPLRPVSEFQIRSLRYLRDLKLIFFTNGEEAACASEGLISALILMHQLSHVPCSIYK